MKRLLRITSCSPVVMRGAFALVTGLLILFVLAAVPLSAQLQFGTPVKTANVNLGPPIWDQDPNITSDGLSMYLTSRQRPGPEYPIGDFYQYIASRNSVNDDWGTPEPLPVALNQGGDAGASITPDGLGLYYSSGGEFGPAAGADIHLATRESVDSAWEIRGGVIGVNVSGFADVTPDISSDGLELYFASNRPDGQGAYDIWSSRRSSLSNPWSEPENLTVLNTTGTEAGPDLSTDGLWLFYGSTGSDQGRPVRAYEFDLWATQRATLTSPWSEPIRLPESINDVGALYPHLSPDGATLYFGRVLVDTSNLSEAANTLDIWEAPILGLLGDFNGNGVLDVDDINDLTWQSARLANLPAYDLNADSLVDKQDITVWVKDLFNTWMGDVDLDGEFKSSDLVDVLASGTFETDVDSVWSTGDFNGDGRTDTSDLVVALADGGFEQGPRGVAAAVPEPRSILLLVVGIIGMIKRRTVSVMS